jgi:methylglyoxal synthase
MATALARDPLPKEVLEALSSVGRTLPFEDGEAVAKVGRRGRAFSLLLEGVLAVHDRNGEAIAMLAAGDPFGEIGFLLDGPRVATLRAVTRGRALRVEGADLDRWIDANPALARDFLLWLARRLATRLSAQVHDTRRFVALVAHDSMKDKLVAFARAHREELEAFHIVATATTAKVLLERAGLAVARSVASGPLGGDMAIGTLVSTGNVDALFFFKDPLTPQAHQADIEALSRLCDVHDVPLATNPATAEALLRGLVSRAVAPAVPAPIESGPLEALR